MQVIIFSHFLNNALKLNTAIIPNFTVLRDLKLCCKSNNAILLEFKDDLMNMLHLEIGH